jgi:chromosome segregation ATPase
MVGAADIVYLAQNYNWLMIVLLWLGAPYAYKSISNNISDMDEKVDGIGVNQAELSEQVNRLDQKQDHLGSRQEKMLERLGMNSDEIQELQRETARLDERHRQDDSSYGGPDSDSTEDD